MTKHTGRGVKATGMCDALKLLLLAAGFLFPVFCWGQGLPAGEGRDEMVAACSGCHSMKNIIDPHKKFTAEEWEFYLYDMIARGAPVYEEDIESIRQYLIDNFAAD